MHTGGVQKAWNSPTLRTAFLKQRGEQEAHTSQAVCNEAQSSGGALLLAFCANLIDADRLVSRYNITCFINFEMCVSQFIL